MQWNLSYPNPLGPGVVHKSEKSVPLKLHINNLKIALRTFLKFIIINYSNRTVTTLIEQLFLWLTENPDNWGSTVPSLVQI